MQNCLLANSQPRRCKQYVGITRQQQNLKKEHAGVPHCRRSTESRQQHLRHYELNPEQQEGTEERRSCKQWKHTDQPQKAQKAQKIAEPILCFLCLFVAEGLIA